MGAAPGEEGYETDSSNKIEVANTMRRAASVDDLFEPMWSLNVHANALDSRLPSMPVGRSSSPNNPNASRPSEGPCSTGEAPTIPTGALTIVRIASVSGQPRAPVRIGERISNSLLHTWGYSSAPTSTTADIHVSKAEPTTESLTQHLQPTDSEKIWETAGSSPRGITSSLSSCELERAYLKSSLFSFESDPCSALAAGARGSVSTTKSYPGGGNEVSALPRSQSTSDDDQLNGSFDERKAKRMLSNRESARRSRLRKQQHLDELRSQIANLRAQNSDMHAKFSAASQRFSQLAGENQILRSHAVGLTQKLRELYNTLSAQHPRGLQGLGIQTGHLDPDPVGSFSPAQLSPYSQQLVTVKRSITQHQVDLLSSK